MKKSFLQFSALVLATTLVLPAFAQTVTKSGNREAAASSEITWTRGESRELANMRVELDIMRKRDSDNHPSVIEMQHRIDALESRQPWLLSFDFSGGPLSKFFNLVGRTKVISFNIVASDPNDLAAELPPFSLRNANSATMIGVLTNLLDQRGYTLKFFGDPNEANSMTCVLTKRPGSRAENDPHPTQFESFPVAQYLTEQSIDDIVGAIRAGWELDPAHDKDSLKLKFHQPTSILLVSGPADATYIAGKIISQLKRPPVKIMKVNTQGEPLPETKKE